MPKPETPGDAAILPLRVEGVGLTLGGSSILRDVSFELEAGPCSVILGPNGSGKSMLLRICHGLLAPSVGRVRWCGPGAREAERGQAMVLQRPVLLRRRVAANLEYPLHLRGLGPAERRERVATVLERASLGALADRPARALSVGEQQRVAVARAWAVEPEVLWLDEPAGALDPGATRALEETILRICATGTKVVMTTHDLGQARRLADEVLFLHQGRVLEKTAAEAFFDEPQSAEARAFLKGELLT